jgi:hypothetical protein
MVRKGSPVRVRQRASSERPATAGLLRSAPVLGPHASRCWGAPRATTRRAGDRMSPDLKTPPHRRLVRTNTPGIYRRGDATSRSPTTAASGSRRRTTRSATPVGRGLGDVCVRAPPAASASRTTSTAGWSSTAAAPPTGSRPRPKAYAWTMRTHVVPYVRAKRIGDIGGADVKRFVDHLAALAPRQRQNGAARLAPRRSARSITPRRAILAEAYELEISRQTPRECASSSATAGNRSAEDDHARAVREAHDAPRSA